MRVGLSGEVDCMWTPLSLTSCESTMRDSELMKGCTSSEVGDGGKLVGDDFGESSHDDYYSI